MLILDEATSAVDNETEAAIQRSLARVADDPRRALRSSGLKRAAPTRSQQTRRPNW